MTRIISSSAKSRRYLCSIKAWYPNANPSVEITKRLSGVNQMIERVAVQADSVRPAVENERSFHTVCPLGMTTGQLSCHMSGHSRTLPTGNPLSGSSNLTSARQELYASAKGARG